MNLLDAARQALEAMEDVMYRADTHEFYNAKEALRQAIEQAEQQEPVAWIEHIAGGVEYNPYHKAALKLPEGMRFDLYTTPPQRKLEPLSDEHPLMVFAKECVFGAYAEDELGNAAKRAIKAAHGITGDNT